MANETLFPVYNGTTPVDMIAYGNTITNNLFGLILLMSLWVVLMYAIYGAGSKTEDSITISTFITTIVSWLFASLNLIGSNIAIGFTVALAGSVILLWRGD